jgi:hypothetical protein
MRQLLLSFLRMLAYGGDLDPTKPACVDMGAHGGCGDLLCDRG